MDMTHPEDPGRAEPMAPSVDLQEHQRKAKPRRKSPKSAAEQLIELEARAELLRETVEKQRIDLRVKVVEDLLKKYKISPIQGDPSEVERLGKLREELGL